MACTTAQQWIMAGLRPGTRSPDQLQLGFHLARCASCQAFLGGQPPTNAVFLAALLATPLPARRPSHAPRRRWWPLVSGMLVLALGLLVWAGTLVIGTLPAQTAPILAQAGPSAAPSLIPPPPTAPGLIPAQTAPILTPGASARPAVERRPEVGYAPLPTVAMPPEISPTPPLPQIARPLAPRTILLLGLDRRPGETELSRADSILVLHVDPLSPSLALLSLPRDLWVTVPGADHWIKINAAYSWGEAQGGPAGGAALASRVVEEVIGQPIDYTLVMTFQGLIDLIDQLGGIEVDVPQALYDATFPTFDYGFMTVQFAPGRQQMDGFTALVYSRTRHADSDFQRTRRQQLVLVGIFRKLQQLGQANSAGLARLSAQLQDDFEYFDLERLEALRLAQAVAEVDLTTLRREAVDLRHGTETSTIDGAYIIMPDLAAIQALAADLFGR